MRINLRKSYSCITQKTDCRISMILHVWTGQAVATFPKDAAEVLQSASCSHTPGNRNTFLGLAFSFNTEVRNWTYSSSPAAEHGERKIYCPSSYLKRHPENQWCLSCLVSSSCLALAALRSQSCSSVLTCVRLNDLEVKDGVRLALLFLAYWSVSPIYFYFSGSIPFLP